MKQLLILLLGAALLYGAQSMEALLKSVERGGALEAQQESERLERFINTRDERAQMLLQIKADLAREKRRSEQLGETIDTHEAQLKALEEELHRRSGVLGELFGVVRQYAGEFRAQAQDSVVSAQYPERIDFLKKLADAKELPEAAHLERFWYLLLEQMSASGQIVRFEATVVTPQGQSVVQPVVRLGDFGAISQGRYLLWHGPSLALVQPDAQPPSSVLTQAERFARADKPAAVAVDPSGGAILALYELRPNLLDRIMQGGMIGYIILALGAIGVVLGLIQVVRLGLQERQIRAQLTDLSAPREDNALGRILLSYRSLKGADPESVEAALDEAILRELPPLEKAQGLLKLLAAVAPLLGLLGTVVGMIATFQAITLFGTGDPKLMAGGISQALVTTMLGLSVAVPLLFLHGWLRFRSGVLAELLESQGVGLIAAHQKAAHGA